MRTVLAALALVVINCSAKAAAGRCLLEVNGRAYLLGPCSVDYSTTDKGFQIGSVNPKSSSNIFADVQSLDGKSAVGYWNEKPGASHAHSELGQMRRSGSCWVNETAKVCAWK